MGYTQPSRAFFAGAGNSGKVHHELPAANSFLPGERAVK
jgi:hypothetical protein